MRPEVELLSRFFAAINCNDMGAMAAEFAPDVLRVEPDGFATSGTYRGSAEVTENVRKGRATWAEGSCQPEEFFVVGDKIVVYLHAWVRLHGASTWTGGRFADGFSLRDGKIVEFRTFWERSDALKWAGITQARPR